MLKQLKCRNWVARLAIGLIGAWLLTGCAMWGGGLADRNHTPITFSDAEMESFGSKLRHLNGDAESAYKLGLHYQKKGKHHWAIKEFEKAVAIDQQQARYYNALGVSHDNRGAYAAAKKAYRHALEIDAEMACVWNNLGYSAMLQERPAEAVAHYQKALALDEKNSLYRNNLKRAEARLPAGSSIASEGFRPTMTIGDKATSPIDNPPVAAVRMESLPKPAARQPNSSDQMAFIEADDMRLPRPESAKPTGPMDEGLPSQESKNGQATPRSVTIITEEPARLTSPAEVMVALKSNNSQATPRTITIITEEPARLISPADVMETLAKLGKDAQPIGPTPPGEDSDPPPEKPRVVTVQTDGSGLNGFQFTIKPVLKSKPQLVGSRGGATVLSFTMPDVGFDDVPLMAASIRIPLQTAEKLEREIGYAQGDYIKVVNGNGVNGMARMVGRYLVRQGFSVGHPANADHFGHRDTVLYFLPGYQQEARAVAEALPGHQEIKETTAMLDRRAIITLRIGHDVVPHRAMFSRR